MTPGELTACLHAIGWSRLALAKRLGRPPNVVERWHNQQSQVPPVVAAWLRVLAGFHRDNPPPKLVPVPKDGPRDETRLARLRELVEARQMSWPEAARAMGSGETAKALQSLGLRYGIKAPPRAGRTRAKPAEGPTAPPPRPAGRSPRPRRPA